MTDYDITTERHFSLLETSLEAVLAAEKRKLELWSSEISGLPDGVLYMYTKAGRFFFKSSVNGITRGISRDIDLIYQLARKRYLSIRIRETQSLIHEACTSGAGTKSSESDSASVARKLKQILEKYVEAGLDIFRITLSPEQYTWVHADFIRNPTDPSGLKFETFSGIKVRSKSEQSIGNELELRGIPYRYECRLSFDVSWLEGVTGAVQGRYKYYYPDFMILTLAGDLILWEHLGCIDQKGYRVHNMEKIAAYRTSGFCDDAHLILTFEKDMENLEVIRHLIAKRILPYV